MTTPISQTSSAGQALGPYATSATHEREPLVPHSATPTSPEEVLAMQVAEHLDRQSRSERSARRASQQVQASHQRQQVQALHDAADKMAAAAIVGAVGGAMAGAGKAYGGVAGLGGGGGGGASPAQSTGGSNAQIAQGSGEAANAIGTGLGGFFQAEAKHLEAAAAQHGHSAERAGQIADEHREDAQKMDRLQEQTLGHLDQILQARRQAEQNTRV